MHSDNPCKAISNSLSPSNILSHGNLQVIHSLLHYLHERQEAKLNALHHPEDSHSQNFSQKSATKPKGKKKNQEAKKGMFAAVEGLVAELTALGFASLVLISFQSEVSSVCGELLALGITTSATLGESLESLLATFEQNIASGAPLA